jgi:hypothetical protein
VSELSPNARATSEVLRAELLPAVRACAQFVGGVGAHRDGLTSGPLAMSSAAALIVSWPTYVSLTTRRGVCERWMNSTLQPGGEGRLNAINLLRSQIAGLCASRHPRGRSWLHSIRQRVSSSDIEPDHPSLLSRASDSTRWQREMRRTPRPSGLPYLPRRRSGRNGRPTCGPFSATPMTAVGHARRPLKSDVGAFSDDTS